MNPNTQWGPGWPQPSYMSARGVQQVQHGQPETTPEPSVRSEAWTILTRLETSLPSQKFMDQYVRLPLEERTPAIFLEFQCGRIKGPVNRARTRIDAQARQYNAIVNDLQNDAQRRRTVVQPPTTTPLAENRNNMNARNGPRVTTQSEVIDLTGDSPEKPRKRKLESVEIIEAKPIPSNKRPSYGMGSNMSFETASGGSSSVSVNREPNPEARANHQAPASSASPKPISLWAVKVGWLPGMYNKEDARLQTYHYPNKEYQKFYSETEARSWLATPSADSQIDAQNRSPNYERVDRQSWTRYLERTWDHRNRNDTFGYREMLKVLRRLFIEACSFEDMVVDWSVHALPQHILAAAEQQNVDIALSGNLVQQDALRRKDGLPMVEARGPCDCGVFALMASNVIICANPDCPVVLYHKPCVGMASRPDTGVWPCRRCRFKSSAAATRNRPSLSDDLEPPTVEIESLAPSYIPVARNGGPEPPLNQEQQRVVDSIVRGNNVFYSGSAGVGKSTVLNAFVKRLKAEGKQVDILAPSGIAALNVGGTTIFSYAGWHPDSFKEPLSKLREQAHRTKTYKRLNQTDVLVIDEISMVEADMLVRLDSVMREVRAGWQPTRYERKLSPHHRDLPFGGAQIVCTGDFLQLPPVKPFRFCVNCGGEELEGYHAQNGRPLKCLRCRNVYKDEDKWAFRAAVWKDCKFKYFELRHIHRQSDARFIAILQRCRFGEALTEEDKKLLLADKPEPVGAVRLLPRKMEVDTENRKNFEKLQAVQRTFECLDHFSYLSQNEPELKKKALLKYPNRPEGPLVALKDHRLEETIHLKEGMLVILLANLDFVQGLVNGSQGRIVGFEKHDPCKVFPPQEGPGSPQMGRVRLTGKMLGDAPQSEHAALKESLLQRFVDRAAVKQWPIVEFLNGVVQPIYPQCQTSEFGLEKPYSVLARTQIPLLAAWAITVHRSQGMTLSRVMVDLHNTFEQQQVYVALSRARSLEGLKVVRLASRINAGVNQEVHEFLKEHDMLWKG